MKDSQLETLAGLNIACHFFYQAFHHAPTEDFIATLGNEALMEHWPLEANSSKTTEALALINQSVADARENKISPLAQDYAALFVGPDKLKAAPWGSVYLTEEQTTCGESTLAIKAFYREFGVEIDTGENEPEDHIGLIFAFLAHLTDQALNTTEKKEEVQPWLCATGAFLTDHVLTWAPRFLNTMKENAETEFYQGISLLAEDTLEQLAKMVDADYKIVRLYR